MYKYKYPDYEHESGMVVRGDLVAAFIPTHVGRKVATAEVVGINANTIRVKYEFKGETYEATLKDHQWCLYLKTVDNHVEVNEG